MNWSWTDVGLKNKERKMLIPISKADKDKARSLLEKAISFYHAAGKEICLAEFMNPRGQFVRDHLYVFAVDLDGIMLAHPINERFAGKNFLDVRDSDGRDFIREILESAKRNGSGFIDYKWYHPLSKEERTKTVYYEKTDGMIICSGFYSPVWNCFADSKKHYPENFFELLDYVGA